MMFLEVLMKQNKAYSTILSKKAIFKTIYSK